MFLCFKMRATQRQVGPKIETKFRTFSSPVKLVDGWAKCESVYHGPSGLPAKSI